MENWIIFLKYIMILSKWKYLHRALSLIIKERVSMKFLFRWWKSDCQNESNNHADSWHPICHFFCLLFIAEKTIHWTKQEWHEDKYLLDFTFIFRHFSLYLRMTMCFKEVTGYLVQYKVFLILFYLKSQVQSTLVK